MLKIGLCLVRRIWSKFSPKKSTLKIGLCLVRRIWSKLGPKKSTLKIGLCLVRRIWSKFSPKIDIGLCVLSVTFVVFKVAYRMSTQKNNRKAAQLSANVFCVNGPNTCM